MTLGPRARTEYLALRSRFQPKPKDVRLAIIAESPPVSGKYFYDPDGDPGEPLFSALMKVFGLRAASKEYGLDLFKLWGLILVDATYEPVNGSDATAALRNRVIVRDYPLLCADLDALLSDRSTPLILIKANVCRLLEPMLRADGFNVLNAGSVIPFPATGQQKRFPGLFKDVAGRLTWRPLGYYDKDELPSIGEVRACYSAESWRETEQMLQRSVEEVRRAKRLKGT